MDIPSVETLFRLAWPYVVSSGGAGAFLYWLLKRKLEDRFTRELERTKHDLQLEQQKMSIVFEHQKDSFRKMLVAMRQVLKAIEDKWSDGEFSPISQKDLEVFQEIVSEERLFLDGESDHAVQLFRQIAWRVVRQPPEAEPESSKVAACYTQMHFISERLAEHFRARVGLPPEVKNPLFDVLLLGACLLINGFHFVEFSLPTESPLKIREGETAEEVVAAARQKTGLLRSELMKLREAITCAHKSSFFYAMSFQALPEVDLYLGKLAGYKELTISKAAQHSA